MATKIFLVEDNKKIIKILTMSLRLRGYTTLLVAVSRKEGLEKIKEAKEGVEIAIVDGSLGTSTYRGEDGYEIAKALRREVPGIKIISFSADKMTWGDYNLRKPEDSSKLFELIKELTT